LRRQVAACALGACLALASRLDAFQLETTDDPDCMELPGVNCPHKGISLDWFRFPVFYFVNSDSSGLGFTTARNAISAAFQSWQSASGDGIVFSLGGQTQKGSDGNDGCNVVSWQDLGDSASDTFAQSILTFDTGTGELIDVDIELNSTFPFAVLPAGEVDPSDSRVDVKAVTTHEAGHLLGLAHENQLGPQVVMYFEDTTGDTTHRTLTSDDRQGVRAVYPDAAVLTASPPSCAGSGGGGGGGGGGGCSLARPRPDGSLWPMAAVIGWLVLRRSAVIARRRQRVP
jgi:matrixin